MKDPFRSLRNGGFILKDPLRSLRDGGFIWVQIFCTRQIP
jgi:hypothetical protein